MLKNSLPRPLQPLNSGVLTIYGIYDISPPGERPEQGLYVLHSSVRFHERTVGLNRFWTGLSQDMRINKVCRVPRLENVQSGDVVAIKDRQYVIKMIQYIEDTMHMDISLERLTKTSVVGR